MPALDHLILLVPSLEDSSFDFLASAGFNTIKGGVHKDGLTGNSLLILDDGIYIELIAFVDPSRTADRAKHWWGPKTNGWIDYSTSPFPDSSESVLDAIKVQAGGEELYDAPQAGGRVTTDGKELKWKVTFPKLEEGQLRGVRPFWCEDVSPREWRVPAAEGPHPNGVSHVVSITLLAKPDGLLTYQAKLAQILVPTASGTSHAFELTAPKGGKTIQVYIKEPSTEDEKKWIEERGEGLYEVVLGGAKEEKSLGAEQGARIVLTK